MHLYKKLTQQKSLLNFFQLVIVLNFFQNMALLIANLEDQDVIESTYYWPFHFLDFGQSFAFALIEAIYLIKCGYVQGVLSFAIIIVNVGGTLIALILFLFAAEFFEPTSHWIEYSVQFCVTFTSFAFIFGNQDKTSVLYKYRYFEAGLVCLSLAMAGLKLLVYGEVIEFEIGAERAAHFFEYTGEMFNDAFALAFTIIRLKAVKNQIMIALYGSEKQVAPLLRSLE